MTTKASFNAEEWALVTTAPALAGLFVAASEPGGQLRESVALSRGYAEARAQKPGELLEAILTTAPSLGPQDTPRTPDEIRNRALADLRRAVRILDRLAQDDELVAYKRFVYTLATEVAQAHREGGFLGIGGKPISDNEQAALDAIAAIFDEPIPAVESDPQAQA
jgi:hypothetical protein